MTSLLGSTQPPLALAGRSSTPSTPLSLGAEIATYLQADPALALNFSGAGTKNLFVSGMPDTAQTPELAVSILENAGMAPVMTLVGGSLPVSKLDRPMVQIRVRAPMGGYITGNALINRIYGALQQVGEKILNPPNGAYFHLIMAQQSPVYLGRDDLQRHGWTLNMAVWWENDQR